MHVFSNGYLQETECIVRATNITSMMVLHAIRQNAAKVAGQTGGQCHREREESQHQSMQ